MDTYDELAVKIEQVIERVPWFQRLSPTRTDIPVYTFSDTKLYVSSPHSPRIVLATALKLCDPRLNHFRVLTSIFNPTLFTAYDKLLKLGLNGETIVDASLYNRLHEENIEHFLDDSEYKNLQMFCLDEELTLGIGILDDLVDKGLLEKESSTNGRLHPVTSGGRYRGHRARGDIRR